MHPRAEQRPLAMTLSRLAALQAARASMLVWCESAKLYRAFACPSAPGHEPETVAELVRHDLLRILRPGTAVISGKGLRRLTLSSQRGRNAGRMRALHEELTGASEP